MRLRAGGGKIGGEDGQSQTTTAYNDLGDSCIRNGNNELVWNQRQEEERSALWGRVADKKNSGA